MNKQQLHDEFDDRYMIWADGASHEHREDIKSFYDKKIDEILQELVGEEVRNYPEDNEDMWNERGWNNHRQKIIDKIKELGYE